MAELIPIANLRGPQGIQGPPGTGWNPTILGDTHLDTVTTPGVYSQSSPSKVLLEKGYPFSSSGASSRLTMMVRNWGGSGAVIQTIDTIGTATHPSLSYTRYLETGYNVATPWRVRVPQRVDNTAGRAIYTWDDTANREQLIYGDTGTRNITGNLINGWTAPATPLTIRRTNSLVYLNGTIDGTNMTVDQFVDLGEAMSGFTPHTNAIQGIVHSADYTQFRELMRQNNLIYIRSGTKTSWRINAVWSTNAPWPTVLPGVAAGAIN